MTHEDSPAAPSDWLTLLLHDYWMRAAAGFVFFFCLVPPEGIPGFEMCASMRVSHSPCPGCGMTRCGSNLLRGNFYRALQYHPFGYVVIPLCLTLGAVAFAPRSWRAEFRRRVRRLLHPLRTVLLFFVGVAFLCTLARWGLVGVGWMEFPMTF